MAVLHAWFDGACEPVNPGGLGTYGFVVREGDRLVEARHGIVPDVAGMAMTNNIAEYAALLFLAEWLRDHAGLGDEIHIHGDSKIVVEQIAGRMKANAPHLRHLRDLARAALPRQAELVHLARERNAEADALTHKAYEEAMRADPALQRRFERQLATPAQLAACRRLGIHVYPFMGRMDASRLLARHAKAQERGPEAEARGKTEGKGEERPAGEGNGPA